MGLLLSAIGGHVFKPPAALKAKGNRKMTQLSHVPTWVGRRLCLLGCRVQRDLKQNEMGACLCCFDTCVGLIWWNAMVRWAFGYVSRILPEEQGRLHKRLVNMRNRSSRLAAAHLAEEKNLKDLYILTLLYP